MRRPRGLDRSATPPEWGERRGTRVLVEHRDPVARDVISDTLRDAGYDVLTCRGPEGPAGCPLLRDEPCPAVDAADIVVNGLVAGQQGRAVAERTRRVYPERPIVVEATAWMAGQLGDDVPTVRVYPLLPASVRNAVSALEPSRV